MESRVKPEGRTSRENGSRRNKVRQLKVAVASALRPRSIKAPAVLIAGGGSSTYFELVGWDEV